MLRFSYFPLFYLVSGLLFIPQPKAFAEFKVPKLKSPVIDKASMIDRRSERLIGRALSALNKNTQTQLAVLTVPSLEGLSIEQASIQVVDQWKLGSATGDRGLLLMIARKERKIRIEVGQGLEGQLTDAHSKRIISESMAPLMRNGDTSGAILVGLYQMIQKTNPEVDAKKLFSNPRRQGYRNTRKTRSSPIANVFKLIFFIVLLLFIGPRNLFWMFLGGALSGGSRGGSFGGGSFGGGGYSGGGGGFSGGGASGGW